MYLMIIETKLNVPTTKGITISRPHLFQRLDEGLNTKLTIITSPAGYGKSTLLSKWSSQVNHPNVWISLDENDNNPFRFWTHTIESLKQCCSVFNDKSAAYYLDADPSGNTLVATLINQLSRLSEKVVLIWDDFHIIENDSILSCVNYLLDSLPKHVHVYMSSRYQPLLSLSRLRIEGNLIEIGVKQLQFGLEESKVFFEECTDIKLSTEENLTILNKTEGWIAGMRLIALSMNASSQRGNQMTDLLDTTTGKHRTFTQYFFDEVFTRLSEEIQSFLLKTSILDRMNAALCEAITNLPNGMRTLQRLENENLFLVSLDNDREWFRYHHLFQEYLQKQIEIEYPNELNLLHFSAGQWLENNGFVEEALTHYIAGEKYEEALNLLEKIIPSLSGYEKVNLYEWLNKIPDYLLFKRPMLFLTNIASLFLSGYMEDAERRHWWAINELQQTTMSLTTNQAEIFKVGLDFLVAYRTFLKRDFESFIIYSRNYVANKLEGNILVNFGTDRDGHHSIWDVYLSDGNLKKAEEILPVLIDIWSQTQNKPFYAHLCIDYAKVLYEKNCLEDALHYVREALVLCNELGNVGLYVKASLMMAQIDFTQNRIDMFDMRIIKLTEYVKSKKRLALMGIIEEFSVQTALRQGNNKVVSDWFLKNKVNSSDEISTSMMNTYYLLTRILVVQDKSDEAMELLNKLLYLAEDNGMHQDVIRFTIYKSLLYVKQNKIEKGIRSLDDSLILTKFEGHIRTFLDFGVELEKLLGKYVQSNRDNYYNINKDNLLFANQLLEQFTRARRKGSIVPFEMKIDRVKDLLTNKECSVLKLIQQGYSNKAIAEELDISLSTVKTHINNMYRKLDVNNRISALKKGVEMKLL